MSEQDECEDILESLRQLKPELTKKYPSINFLGLFGPYARGEQHFDNDVGILIGFDFSKGVLTQTDFSDIQRWISDRLGKRVNLVDKLGLNRRIGQRILAEVQEV